MNKPRVLLADDHTLVMEGLQSLLAGQVDVVGTARDGRALLQSALELKPDVIILDISMPVLNGIEAARRLRKELPGSKLIFLSMFSDAIYIDEAFRMGVSGYVLKRSAASELIAAIQAVQKGKRFITPSLGRFRIRPRPLRGELPVGAHLTVREREVLQLVAEGRSAKEIAAELRISSKTAQFHKANLMRRLDLHTTAELVKYAVRRRITPA
jgi:DNA-binding NarL/FixJ family response regulator